MKEINDYPNYNMIKNPFANKQQSIMVTPTDKNKISINNINVNTNNLNLNTNTVLISKKDNDNINVSLFSKPTKKQKQSTDLSISPFSKIVTSKPINNDLQYSKMINNNKPSNKTQFNKKMITNLRHQFTEIANKTGNTKTNNISIIESYINQGVLKSYMKSGNGSKENSLNGSFNHVSKITTNPTPTEYNFCETENLSLDSVEEFDKDNNILSTSPNVCHNIGKTRQIDQKAQSLKTFIKDKVRSISKNQSKGSDELKIKYNLIVKRYNKVLKESKAINAENNDLKQCIQIMKASHDVMHKTVNDLIRSVATKDYSHFINTISKQKEETNYLIKQNNRLKKLILLMYNTIILSSNNLIDSDKETDVMLSQLVTENKMLRTITMNSNNIHYHKRHSIKHKEKKQIDKRKHHWDETTHNRSNTTIKLSETNSLNTTAIHNNSLIDNNNNNSCSNISSQSLSNSSYSGQFGNSHLYLKVRLHYILPS